MTPLQLVPVWVLFAVYLVPRGLAADYYCNPRFCPSGDAHIGCYAQLPFGGSCLGLQPQVIEMTTARKSQILEQHNRQRQRLAIGALPGYATAYRMPQLYWDDELQYLAEANARSCVYGHDRCRNTVAYPRAGQNIAIIRHFGLNVTQEQVYRFIIDHWYNEYPLAGSFVDAYPTDYVGPDFAHFTQIINDRAVRMACGMTTWRTWKYGYVWTNDYLVCNYAYSNVLGEQTYTKGPTAGGCPNSRSPNYPGLCL
ncbi:antigen 5 like allergen Cul n 1-like [Anopheles nili]|uniref:antigen 5 like allergen Cul n 1-like n=1 Tax=Anopheles nili TaxID=185578 RepID=UPI00237B1E07|nr:antigen 5 like allergen Cul n 1-like [Anopheles nili]